MAMTIWSKEIKKNTNSTKQCNTIKVKKKKENGLNFSDLKINEIRKGKKGCGRHVEQRIVR